MSTVPNYEKFDNAMKEFLRVCEKILEKDAKSRLIGTDSTHNFFNKYQNSFLTPQKKVREDTRLIHIDRVVDTLQNFQNLINQGTNLESDNWLLITSKPVVIDFGAGSPVKGIKLLSSSIYKKAKKLRTSAENFIKGKEELGEDVVEELRDEH